MPKETVGEFEVSLHGATMPMPSAQLDAQGAPLVDLMCCACVQPIAVGIEWSATHDAFLAHMAEMTQPEVSHA